MGSLVLTNKMKTKYSLILLVLLSFSLRCFSSEEDLNCIRDSKKEVVLIFANGMFNDVESAEGSLERLKLNTNYTFKYYDIAYHQNESILTQAIEVAEQKFDSASKFLWSYLSDFDGPDWLNKTLKAFSKAIDAKAFLKDVDLRKHLRLYKRYLEKENSNIIIVSHSQGNFYANQAFDILERNIEGVYERVHIVSVATPDSKVSGSSGEYKTLESDGVITSIPLAMKANANNQTPKPGLFDHGFLKHYLNGAPTGQSILDLINITAKDSLSNKHYLPFGYVDESLNVINKWTKKLENKELKRKLEKHECLAVSLFLKTKAWFGEPCEKRNYQAVKELGEWCLETEWSRDVENMCILYGMLPGLGGGRAEGMELFYGDYEECKWNPETIKDELTESVLSKALNFIKTPEANSR